MTDPKQFEVFMRHYQDMVYGIAVRLLGNAADAEDVAQLAFLRAYEHFHQIGASPTAGGWLRTVTTNLCLNHLERYRKRWLFFSEMRKTDDGPDVSEELAEPESLNNAIPQSDRRQMIEESLQKLPDCQRVPLVLFHFEGLSYDEIASKLGVSTAKVKTDIHRARLALKRKIKLDE